MRNELLLKEIMYEFVNIGKYLQIQPMDSLFTGNMKYHLRIKSILLTVIRHFL